MTVRDGAKSAQWYREVFGFELVQKSTRAWLVGKGSCNLASQSCPTAILSKSSTPKLPSTTSPFTERDVTVQFRLRAPSSYTGSWGAKLRRILGFRT
jgi:catechol 2,3-dioxygenase-like lactoylglutathione lyase family enzyme